MYLIVVYWLVGFILAVGIVLPFVAMKHAKDFASAAAHDIRGS